MKLTKEEEIYTNFWLISLNTEVPVSKWLKPAALKKSKLMKNFLSSYF